MSERILVRGVNWIGDAVMSMPAIRAIKRAGPENRVSLLVKPWVAPLFERSRDVDEIILYEDRHSGVSGRLDLAKSLGQKHFDSAVLLQNAFGAALIAYLAGIPRRIGYSRDMRGFLLTDPVVYSGEDRSMHHIEYFLELLRRSGMDAPYSLPWIELALDERVSARQKLLPLKRPVIGITPGAAFGPAKQWMPERFGALIKRVVEELDGSVVIFGGSSEVELAQDIIRHASVEPGPPQAVSMAGNTTLRELAALISECDALVSTDSGPMHIGYATRTPLVAIFGSTEPKLTGPVGYGFKVVRHEMDCSPCFRRQCPEDDPPRCMQAVTVDEVFAALKALIPEARAVFFDRDGTLNHDTGYLSAWDSFKVMHEIDALKQLTNKSFKLIGVTNQSGIARGLINEGFVDEVSDYFIREHGFSGFYHCPHHPDEGCSCRKPEPEMLLRARAEHGVDLKGSFVVGDKEADMLLAKAVGARGVLVKTGAEPDAPGADYAAEGLGDAARWILTNGQLPPALKPRH